jgi:hypothetical protein
MGIPDELKLLRQWTFSFSEAELKRPTHYHYTPEGGLTFEEAVRRAGDTRSFGLYVTNEDPYVLGDIDHVEHTDNPFAEWPVQLVDLLRSNPTYCETSPSGKGIRFAYRLATPELKRMLPGFFFKNAIKMGTAFDGEERQAQINVGHPWMRFTGKEVSWSTGRIAEISVEALGRFFNLRNEGEQRSAPKPVDPSTLPSMEEILTTIRSLPMDQNPRIKRAYEAVFNEPYSHYEYWLKVMMAVHNYAELANKLVECLGVVVEWSKIDKGYKGEEDVYKHWRSFTAKTSIIRYKTLFGLAARYRLFWPVPKARKVATDPFVPMITEYVNFRALVDYYDIKLIRDESNIDVVYVTADSDIIREYFLVFQVHNHFDKFYGPFTDKTLIPSLYRLCQSKGFRGIAHNGVAQFVRTYLTECTMSINLLKYYLDTPLSRMPLAYRENEDFSEQSTVETMFSCLDIDYTTQGEVEREREEALYFAYYRAWLMGLVRNLYMNESQHMNNCILLLTGPEQIRKTSHFKYMLPSFFRYKIAATTHGFAKEEAMRDVVKLSSTNLLIYWDEIEQYLTGETESNFKKIIDNNPQKIIDKYETIEKTVTPTSIYGGTSNQKEFKLGPEGSRRIFHIPVLWVDTELMNKICWHTLLNNLRRDMEKEIRMGRVPWLLTEEQLALQREMHSKLRAKNTLDLLLEEMFHFDQEMPLADGGFVPSVSTMQMKTDSMLSTKEVCDLLTTYGFAALASRRPAVVKSLERLCGEYTHTQRYSVHLARPKCVVTKGLAVQGPYRKWMLPPLRKGARSSMFSTYIDGGEE